MDELDDLLRRAADADGLTRMEFRDPIAAFGEAAILRLEPWLGDARLGAFAVRTIGRAAMQRGAVAAARAVFGRARGGCVDSVRGDIDAILATFSPARWSPSAHRRPVARRGVVRLTPLPQALRDLVARWRADGSPPQDAIPWRRELWLSDLREHPQLRRHEGLLRALPTYLDRAAVRAVCVDASSDAPSAERALVAVMAWGQGENGYGPYRTREILSVEDASDRLWTAVRTLDADGPLAPTDASRIAVAVVSTASAPRLGRSTCTSASRAARSQRHSSSTNCSAIGWRPTLSSA